MDGRMDGWIHLQSSYRVYMYAIFDCLFKACLISYYYIFQLHAYMPTGMHACMHIVTRLLTIRSSTL